MWNLRAFADCGVLRFHKVSRTGAILEVRSRPQAGKWTDDDIVVEAALRRDAVRFDQNVVAQNHVAQHAAGPNRAALADFRLAEKLHGGLEHGVLSGGYVRVDQNRFGELDANPVVHQLGALPLTENAVDLRKVGARV